MKKKIAFSCAGEGFGHIARIAALTEYLKDDYDLYFFIPENVAPFLLRHHPELSPKIVHSPTLRFILKEHQVDYPRTITRNLPYLLGFRKIQEEMRARLQQFSIEAVICDFEPFISRAAAATGIPLLNLNHPGVILKYLSLRKGAFGAQMVASAMTPPAQQTLFCSFYDGDVGPIIRKELRQAIPTKEDFILVYAKNTSRKNFEEALRQFPEQNFVVFPDPDKDFSDYLVRCRGIIAPAGHQLISESLFLKKPILAFPQKRQFEQKLNAKMLVESGCGMEGNSRRIIPSIRSFLDRMEELAPHSELDSFFCLRDDTEGTVERIRDFIERETAGPLSELSCPRFLDFLPEKIEKNRLFLA